MVIRKTTRKETHSTLRQTVLQKCSFAVLGLPFLFVFFCCPLGANGACETYWTYEAYEAYGTNESNKTNELDEPVDSFYARYPYVIVIDEGDDVDISDDYFYQYAASVVFNVSKTELPANDKTLKELRETVLPRISRDSLKVVRVKMRGAASPEGPVDFNRFLSQQRQRTLYDFVAEQLRIPQGDRLVLETVTEDYTYLYKRMMQDGDPDCEKVKRLFDEYMPREQYAELKKALQTIDGGRLWRRMLVTYFPSLRAARMVIVCQRRPMGPAEPVAPLDIAPLKPVVPVVPVAPVELAPIKPIAPIVPVKLPDSVKTTVLPIIPGLPMPEVRDTLPHVRLNLVPYLPRTQSQSWVERYPRRELLSIKTNMLLYGVYMPGYGKWCPIPNIAIEFYPLRGHFTYGASFDCPWWQNYWGHKYFQARNYQVEARYYFRSGSIDRRPEGKGPAFRGWYVQAYAHATVYGICFDENRGWVGEGGGGGLGVGYVLPISKKGHWRLEFQLQAGLFITKYDPYQFENAVNPNFHDQRYYYKWTQKPELFKSRQYRFTWFGPTRVGVTLSYDLLYRRARKKTNGVRMPEGTKPTKHYNPFVSYEKGGRQ